MQSRQIASPGPGFYLVRLVPKGWEVPARIDFDGERYSAVVDESPLLGQWTADELESLVADAILVGELFERQMTKLLVFGRPCTETEYRHKVETKRWAEENAGWHPCLHPQNPIDGRLLPAEDF